MPLEWVPCRFIDQEIEVRFNEPPILTKKPGAPDGFKWAEESFQVCQVISTWFDYQRRGRMAKNMTQPHLRTAAQRGSWGVGRFYFRVQTEDGRVFDLYYDRAPKKAADRTGHWFLWRELEAK